MNDLNDFQDILKKIDETLDSYNPGDLSSDRILGDIISERAAQRPILELVVRLANQGLHKYPFNAELLRRRAFAHTLMVTNEGEYPELDSAEKDLRSILAYEPNNLSAGLDLLELLFTYDGVENRDAAQMASELAQRAEKLLIGFRALQIKALGYAESHDEAEQVFQQWSKVFPQSESLQGAMDSIEFLK